MADYWKSNPKKFCDFCKCWIADNKPSIEFHEKGKNHQQNVKRKISEVRKKTVEKRKKDEEFSKEFAAMEAAALKAVQNDLQKNPSIVGSHDLQSLVKSSNETTESKDNMELTPEPGTSWVICQTPQGYTYYYNQSTGESRWEIPPELQKEKQKSNQNENSTNSKTKLKAEGSVKHSKINEKDNSKKKTSDETDKHPLLGGWTVVPDNNEIESPTSSEEEPSKPVENSTTNDSTQEKETTDPETMNQDTRKRSLIFKEKTIKSSISNDASENVTFKKRKMNSNRGTRKRFDGD